MKISITGHTKGIGLGLYNHFHNKGCNVLGFSRSNGFTLPDSIDKVIELSIDSDIFINNAYPVTSQIELLKKLSEKWHNTNKKIVVLGSLISDVPIPINHIPNYQKDKKDLDSLCKIIRYRPGSPKILLVRPGPVLTNLENEMSLKPNNNIKYMSVDDVVNTIEWAINCNFIVKDILFGV